MPNHKRFIERLNQIKLNEKWKRCGFIVCDVRCPFFTLLLLLSYISVNLCWRNYHTKCKCRGETPTAYISCINHSGLLFEIQKDEGNNQKNTLNSLNGTYTDSMQRRKFKFVWQHNQRPKRKSLRFRSMFGFVTNEYKINVTIPKGIC